MSRLYWELAIFLAILWTVMAFSENYGNGASKNVKKQQQCLQCRGLIVSQSVYS